MAVVVCMYLNVVVLALAQLSRYSPALVDFMFHVTGSRKSTSLSIQADESLFFFDFDVFIFANRSLKKRLKTHAHSVLR